MLKPKPKFSYAQCPFCKKFFKKSGKHRRFCSKECQKQNQRMKETRKYRTKHPTINRVKRPQKIWRDPNTCIKLNCGKPVFYSSRCKQHYKQDFPHKQYCLICNKPLNLNEERSGTCRKHFFSVGEVWIIPNMSAPYNEWKWILEKR